MFKNEEGFSLLELVVAVGVAGIIAAVALPTFAGIQASARSTSATYAASASAAEAQANALLSDTGSGSGSASSSSSSVSFTADFTSAWSFDGYSGPAGNQWSVSLPSSPTQSIQIGDSFRLADVAVTEGVDVNGTYTVDWVSADGKKIYSSALQAKFGTLPGMWASSWAWQQVNGQWEYSNYTVSIDFQ